MEAGKTPLLVGVSEHTRWVTGLELDGKDAYTSTEISNAPKLLLLRRILDMQEDQALFDEIDAAIESGDMNKVVELSKQAPLPPEVALAFKEGFGGDYMKKSGFNLSVAEKTYGKDWLSN